MRQPVVRRIAQAIVVVWLAYTLTFILLNVLPGDAALARIGSDTGTDDISPDKLEALRASLGLDRPAVLQYLDHLGALFTGDLGVSMRTGMPVSGIIGGALPATLGLAAAGFVVAVAGALLLAVLTAWTKTPWLRRLLSSLPGLGLGMPPYIIGPLLVMVFSFGLQWLPSSGSRTSAALVLPAVTVAIVPGAMMAQVLIASLEDALAQPYATTATAKGAGRLRTVVVHCLRNALMPALAIGGVVVGTLIAGSVVGEMIFSRAGLGRVMLDAVNNVDLPVVQGVALVGAVTVVVVGLLVDLLNPLLDARLRTPSRRAALVGAL
jgi:peptide/nickel transport system permease protein